MFIEDDARDPCIFGIPTDTDFNVPRRLGIFVLCFLRHG
jgi:hypothetical protein